MLNQLSAPKSPGAIFLTLLPRALMLLPLLLLLLPTTTQANDLPLQFNDIKTRYPSSYTLLLGRDEQPLAERRHNFGVRRQEWTPLIELSQNMQAMLLLAEDKRFFEHQGVDWSAFAAALVQNLWYHRKRGASTITMQLAGLLEPELNRPGQRRSLSQKWDQTRAASQLESSWSKRQILEAYLNLVYFRGEIQGIRAASWDLFGKQPGTLDIPEAALLSVLLRGPNAQIDRVSGRACALVERAQKAYLCPRVLELAQRLAQPEHKPRFQQANWLLQLAAGSHSSPILSTLNSGIQEKLHAMLPSLAHGRLDEVGVIISDISSGEIIAYDGLANSSGQDPLLRRSNGQALLAPLAVAEKIHDKQLTAASLLPYEIPYGFDSPALSWMDLRTALRIDEQQYRFAAELSNVMRSKITRLGWPDDNQANLLDYAKLTQCLFFYDPPVNNVLRWQAATHTANCAGGLLNRASSFVITDLLHQSTNDNSKVANNEIAQSFAVRDSLSSNSAMFFVASSIGVYDWFTAQAGTQLVTARMRRNTGFRRQAADEIMLQLIEKLADQAPPPVRPKNLVRNLLRFDPPLAAARQEYFLRGTEQTLAQLANNQLRIQWPSAHALVSIPACWLDNKTYRLYFSSGLGPSSLRWQIDGQALGNGAYVGWTPEAGKHQVTLLDASGQLLDQHHFYISLDPHCPAENISN